MSDSTIDDALKLLEKGKGNPDRIKRIIESFQKRSLISLEDRKIHRCISNTVSNTKTKSNN